MSYSFVPLLHVASALLAIALGLAVIVLRKGTRRHRMLGIGYAVSMVILNLTAMFIFNLTGDFSPFHIAAPFSLATVLVGVACATFRQPRHEWLEAHLKIMLWSYFGLLAAAVSEAAVRLPASPFWPAVLFGSAMVFVAGGIALHRALPAIRKSYGLAGNRIEGR